jgi:hypothetical protein
MFALPRGVPNAAMLALPIIAAYLSQAECTLAKYQGNQGSPPGEVTPHNPSQRRPLKCFGCGGPHGYQNKNGNITCPYGHDPKVKENAECKYKAFRQCLEDKYKDRMACFRGHRGGSRGIGGGRGSGGPVDYLKLSAKDQRKIHEQVLAAQSSSHVSELVFMLTVPAAKSLSVPSSQHGELIG